MIDVFLILWLSHGSFNESNHLLFISGCLIKIMCRIIRFVAVFIWYPLEIIQIFLDKALGIYIRYDRFRFKLKNLKINFHFLYLLNIIFSWTLNIIKTLIEHIPISVKSRLNRHLRDYIILKSNIKVLHL